MAQMMTCQDTIGGGNGCGIMQAALHTGKGSMQVGNSGRLVGGGGSVDATVLVVSLATSLPCSPFSHHFPGLMPELPP